MTTFSGEDEEDWDEEAPAAASGGCAVVSLFLAVIFGASAASIWIEPPAHMESGADPRGPQLLVGFTFWLVSVFFLLAGARALGLESRSHFVARSFRGLAVVLLAVPAIISLASPLLGGPVEGIVPALIALGWCWHMLRNMFRRR